MLIYSFDPTMSQAVTKIAGDSSDKDLFASLL